MLQILEETFSKKFLLNPTPTPYINYWPLLIVFGVLVLAAILMFVFAKRDKRRLLVKYAPALATTGTLGLIHLFARYESLPWLAARIFLGGLIFLFLVWLTVLTVWTVKFIPKYKKEKFTDEKFQKYLPKSR